MKDDARLLDRIRGSLLGAAIGDALGSAFEFVSSTAIKRAIGSSIARDYRAALPGSLMAPRRPGIPTDDTAMTLALIEALGQGTPHTPRSVLTGMVEGLRRNSGPVAAMFWAGGPGGACVAMLRAAQAGAEPFERIDPDAGGNGAAMRAHPCGAFADRGFVAELAGMQARLSHPEPAAIASAQVVALVVHDAMYENEFPATIPPEITAPKMLTAWQSAHANLQRAKRLPTHLLDVDMAGWNTVAAAHAIAFLYADEPATALGLAAASGKDTDTIASIVGGMLGALHGVDALPKRLLDGLNGRELIERAATTLHRTVTR
ncbi:MAG TPA: ADP-ribosylglycohydrolase family protein [Candidatus Aquilonibacter sp.]